MSGIPAYTVSVTLAMIIGVGTETGIVDRYIIIIDNERFIELTLNSDISRVTVCISTESGSTVILSSLRCCYCS